MLAAHTDTPAPTSGLPEADGTAVLEDEPYGAWETRPADEWNDFDQFLKSGQPQRGVARTFVNDAALEAATTSDFDGPLPPGSIVLKENYYGERSSRSRGVACADDHVQACTGHCFCD
jgi:hypothetical protein